MTRLWRKQYGIFSSIPGLCQKTSFNIHTRSGGLELVMFKCVLEIYQEHVYRVTGFQAVLIRGSYQ